jgi:hypothetical protein
MKGAQGLIIAAFFGLLGIALNWVYLQNKLRDAETVQFLGIKDGESIKTGDLIQEADLVPVPVPEFNAKKLRTFVYLWEDRNTIAGTRSTRTLEGGELFTRYDYRTPPPELKLKPDERLMWVTVSNSGFVPSLLNPGDQITFIIPTPQKPAAAGQNPAVSTVNSYQEVGPFTIKTLGNRLGTADIMRSQHIAQVQERDIGIIIKLDEHGKKEQRAQTLLDLLSRSNRRDVGIQLDQRAQPE